MSIPTMDKQTLARERQALATLIEVFDRKARQLGEPPFFQASKVLLSGVPSSFSATPPHIDPMLANELKILNGHLWRKFPEAIMFAMYRGWKNTQGDGIELSPEGFPASLTRNGWFIHLNLKTYKEAVGVAGSELVWRFEAERNPATSMEEALEELNDFYWAITPCPSKESYRTDLAIQASSAGPHPMWETMELLPEHRRFLSVYPWAQYPVETLGWTKMSEPGFSQSSIPGKGRYSPDTIKWKWDGRWWVFSRNGWIVTVEIDPEDHRRLRFVPVDELSTEFTNGNNG